MRSEAIATSPGARLRDFIRDHVRPHFRSPGVDCEIWLGTIERPDDDQWAHTVLHDAAARQHVAGIGYQWAGRAVKG